VIGTRCGIFVLVLLVPSMSAVQAATPIDKSRVSAQAQNPVYNSHKDMKNDIELTTRRDLVSR